jgi:hypothetical protein
MKKKDIISDYMRELQAKSAKAVKGTDAAKARARKAAETLWAKKRAQENGGQSETAK